MLYKLPTLGHDIAPVFLMTYVYRRIIYDIFTKGVTKRQNGRIVFLFPFVVFSACIIGIIINNGILKMFIGAKPELFIDIALIRDPVKFFIVFIHYCVTIPLD